MELEIKNRETLFEEFKLECFEKLSEKDTEILYLKQLKKWIYFHKIILFYNKKYSESRKIELLRFDEFKKLKKKTLIFFFWLQEGQLFFKL